MQLRTKRKANPPVAVTVNAVLTAATVTVIKKILVIRQYAVLVKYNLHSCCGAAYAASQWSEEEAMAFIF